MSLIENVFPKYTQKSKLFLYPMLNIKRGQNVSLIETYLGLENKIKVLDNKLVALHYCREDFEFKMFETRHLTGNPLFASFQLVGDDKIAYIFNFDKSDDLKHDFQCVVNGQYSKMTTAAKKIIIDFYNNNETDQMYIASFLNPEHYMEIYSDLLTVKGDGKPEIKKLLEEVGQLCSIPDLQKEILIIDSEKTSENENIISLSSNQQQ